MAQFEIIKKTKIELLIYGLIGLIVIFLSTVLLTETSGGDSFETGHVVLLFVIVAILFVAFKIIPNIPIKKHSKLGDVNFQGDKLIIDSEHDEKEYLIEKLDFINLKLIGWDGQHRFGDIETLGKGNSGLYQDTRPFDGLGNILKFRADNKEFRYEFYADSIAEYENLKKLSKNWMSLNDNVNLKILR